MEDPKVGEKFSDGNREWTVKKVRRSGDGQEWFIHLASGHSQLNLHGTGKITAHKNWRSWFAEGCQ